MKKLSLLLSLLMVFLAGCTTGAPSPTVTASVTPTATATHYYGYDSYVTQTSFSYPVSWEYQEDDTGVTEGMRAIFLTNDSKGQFQVQFVFMSEQEAQEDIWLSQVDCENASLQNASYGGYEGQYLYGTLDEAVVACFTGKRDWYDTSLTLCVRMYLTVPGDESDETLDAFHYLLSSIRTTTDETPEVPTEFEPWEYEEFGLSFQAPVGIYAAPDFYYDEQTIRVVLDLDGQGNTVTIEAGKTTESGIDAFYESMEFDTYTSGAYNGTYHRYSDRVTASCIYEGKIVRAQAWHRTEASAMLKGDTYYVCVTSSLRPVYDSAYQSVVQQIIDSIVQTDFTLE